MHDLKYLAGVQAQLNGSGTKSGAFEKTVNHSSDHRLVKDKA
jgi:hypothetical protein